jgi:pyruvate carboxylase subunit B
MPGKILEIPVSVGDEVEIGEAILILEAMKMENELKASLTGIIHSVQVQTGDSVEKNQILLEIKARG